NVASTNNRIRIPSRTLLQKQVNAAAEIGATGIVVHGGHVQAGDDPEVGFDNWRKCIERLERPVPVLIENTAGGDNAMARGVDRIARLWEAVRAGGGDDVGFCLDTCHAWASGEPLVGLADRVWAATGRIDLVHVNDSRDAFDSGADRHANLGQGHIPADDLLALVRDAGAPAVVETPGAAAEQGADIAWLRERPGCLRTRRAARRPPASPRRPPRSAPAPGPRSGARPGRRAQPARPGSPPGELV